MKKRIGYGACLAAAAFSASAAGADPGIDPGVNKGIGARLTQAITEGDVTFNTRLRYEHADIDGLKEGDSVAIRPRLGGDARDPQGAELALALATVTVGVLACLGYRLLGYAKDA